MTRGQQYLHLSEQGLGQKQQHPIIVLATNENEVLGITKDGRPITISIGKDKDQWLLVDKVPEQRLRGVSAEVGELERLTEQVLAIGKAVGKAVKKGKSLERVRTDLGNPGMTDDELVDYLTHYGCRYDNGCVYLPLGLTDPADTNRWLFLAGFDTGTQTSDIWKEPTEEPVETTEAAIVDINEDPKTLLRLLQCVADSALRLRKRQIRKNIPPTLKDVADGVSYLINKVEPEWRYDDLVGVTVEPTMLQEILEELDCAINDNGIVQIPGWIDIDVITPVTWVEQLQAQAAQENPFGSDDEEAAVAETEVFEELTQEEHEHNPPTLRLFRNEDVDEEEAEGDDETQVFVQPAPPSSDLEERVQRLENAMSEVVPLLMSLHGFLSSYTEVAEAVQKVLHQPGEEN